MAETERHIADYDAGLRERLSALIEQGGERENRTGRGFAPTGKVSIERLRELLADTRFELPTVDHRCASDCIHGRPIPPEVTAASRPSGRGSGVVMGEHDHVAPELHAEHEAVECGAQYGHNPELCYHEKGHPGAHSNRYGTTWGQP